MKQYMKKLSIMAVLLLTVVGAWAEQTVNIVYKNADRGTVTSQVSNGVCTLTATPTTGYYITAENLTAVKVVDGGSAQTPRHAPGIGQEITISATNPDAEPSGVTTYTFDMPTDANVSVEVTADFQEQVAIKPSVTLQGWTYGEDPNDPVVEGNTGGGAVTYTYAVKGSTEYTETVPSAAGTYVVKAAIAAKGLYAAGEATAEFTISKADVTLSFKTQNVMVDIREKTYQQPVTATVEESLVYNWESSEPSVATVSKDGVVTLLAIGETTITATFEGTDNYNSAEASYTLSVDRGYGLKVNDVLVTETNHSDVLGDDKVFFDTKNKLVLKETALNSIEVLGFEQDELILYLIGENKLTASEPAIINSDADRPMALTLTTDGSAPGSLIYTMNSATLTDALQAFVGFSPVSCENQLAMTLDEDAKTVYVKMSIQPIVNDSTEEDKTTIVDFSEDGEVNSETLTNIIINNILYTLNDTQTPEANDDGFANNEIVLNSTVTDEDLNNAMNLQPGTQEYAEAFKGLTFSLPPGTGTITIESHEAEGHALCVKIGKADPVVISHEELKKDVIDYAVTEPTYVYIYHVELTTAQASPNRRIGPKTTVSTGMTGLNVSANAIDTPPSASSDYFALTAEALATAFGSILDGEGLTVDDESITDLDDDVFSGLFGAQSAPRRAGATRDIPFIDLRSTKIVGKEVDRTSGAFRQIPENTFIYLPAGNTALSPNVIVGSVCDDMQLTAESEKTFKVVKDFTASTATFDRSFTQGEGKSYTVYLPYGIQTEQADGTFFEYAGYDNTTNTVNLTAVTEPVLEANTPYIFTPSATGAMKPMTAVKVKSTTATSAPDATSEAEGLHGVFKYHKWNSEPSNIYCYAADDKDQIRQGQFAKVGAGTFIRPFRAYLRISGIASAPQYIAVNWGDGRTSIVPLDKENVQQDADGWYTISGFRLPAKPTEKGVYIHNHKKTVVK